MKRTLTEKDKQQLSRCVENLKSFCMEKNISEDELALKAHVDKKVLNRFMKLEDDIDIVSLYKLIKALDIDSFEFYLRMATDEELDAAIEMKEEILEAKRRFMKNNM